MIEFLKLFYYMQINLNLAHCVWIQMFIYLKKLNIAFLGLSANFSTGHSWRNFRDLLKKREILSQRTADML